MIFKDVLTLSAGKKLLPKIWDILLISRRTFTSEEDIIIESDKSLILHSPKIDGELVIDGEGYIL
jgi:hypothetical protein